MNLKSGNGFKLVFSLVLLLICQNSSAEEIEARLNWYKKASLGIPVSGVVAEITAQVGSKVKKGDVLLMLDDRIYQAELDHARVNLKYHERLNKEAKQELERNIELYERTVLSNHELEAAHIAYEKNSTALMLAQSLFAQAEFNLQYSKITAPFDGIVINQHASEGQAIISQQTAQTLVEVAATDNMVAELVVTGAVLRGMAIGKKVVIWIGKKKLNGIISAIAYEPIPNSNRYLLKAKFNSKGKLFRAGRKVKVILP